MDAIGNNLLSGYDEASLMGEPRIAFAPPQQGQSGASFVGDSWGSTYPPRSFGFAGAGGEGSFGGLIAGFMSVMQGFMSQIGQMMQGMQAQQGASAGFQTPQRQQYFSTASLRSTGDPHDAFSGTAGTGRQVNGAWDSMSSHDHLITSNGIPGGFNVATTATPPQGGGVAYNQSATITMDRGNTTVTMERNGACSVIDHGQAVPLAVGQTSSLGNGQTVTLNRNGSLVVNVSNAQGGNISTTLSYNGNGVDVNATANNVDLGGYLADKQDGWS